MKQIAQYLTTKSNILLNKGPALYRQKQLIISPFSYDNGEEFINKYRAKRLFFVNDDDFSCALQRKYLNLNLLIYRYNKASKSNILLKSKLKLASFFKKFSKKLKRILRNKKKSLLQFNFRKNFKYFKVYGYQKKHLRPIYKSFQIYNQVENKLNPFFNRDFKKLITKKDNPNPINRILFANTYSILLNRNVRKKNRKQLFYLKKNSKKKNLQGLILSRTKVKQPLSLFRYNKIN